MNDLGAVMNEEIEVKPGGGADDAWMFPTSFAQSRLWFIDQVEPGNTLYNVPSAFRIAGRLDAGALERSFAHVIARHEILRTTFRAVDGAPMQIVAEEMEFHLPVVDLRGLPEGEREAEALRIVREESARPFDLARGPLMRAALIELGAAEQALVVSLHHIITDSWSQDILMGELVAAYSAWRQGGAPPMRELPIQYADFAEWQRETVKGEALGRELEFWRKRLDGLAPLGLPQLPRQANAHPPEGATINFTLDQKLTAALRKLAQETGVTLFMALLAGWKAFLARYTGQTDIAVGSPISDRTRTETEGLIGFFLNTLVLRTDLSGNPTVRDALARVRNTALESFAHQDLPFELIVENLHPAREPGRNPLLRVMFVLMTGEEKSRQTPDGVLAPMRVEESKAKFDLMLHLRDTGCAIEGALVYDKALFNATMARRITSHFETVLDAMAAQPETRIESLPLIAPEERARILIEWNDTDAAYPRDRTIHSLFREQARLNPEAVAIEDRGEVISYGELDGRSDSIASMLIARGVKEGDAVGIEMARSAELICGILGILKCGAAYVPLDPSYPPGRLAVMLRESGARVSIGGSGSGGEDGGVSRLTQAECDAAPAGSAPERGHADAPAYIMFTSGSTGAPKGVRVLHRGISRLVINTNYVEFTPADVVAHASNTSFDASTFEIWGALLHGARLVIVPKETLLAPQEFAAFIRERGITVLFLTTPLFHYFAGEIPGAFSSLRYLVAGGDALQPEAARAVLQAGRPAHLVNGYGPTEVTTFAVCHEVTDVPADATSVPIGKPISNTRAYILDTALEPVPPGIPGELYLGGPGVAGGYVNCPEISAASFIADPFSDEPGARLYKTGDLARWREDGVIEFLGRADNQVKIRGFRVEPAEIEATLLRHAGVRQAMVTARPDTEGGSQLAAYIVRQPGAATTAEELRRHVLAALPEHMTPGAFAFLDALPLNANGKVDAAALAAVPLARTEASAQIPGTWMEATLVEVWEDVLDRAPIGVTDDFFELGGHSLLAIRMLAEVEKRTGIRISPRVLFENATIRHLAMAAWRPDAETRPAMALVQRGGSLTPLFFLHGDFVEGGLYCVKLARCIGAERPFYAIDPHGVHDVAPRSIEEMARQRLELVRQAQPGGPYALGGFCNGALVAFEMARQLEAAGEKVASLVLISVDGSNAEFSWLERLIGFMPAREELKFQTFIQWRERILFARAAWNHQLDDLSKPARAVERTGTIARKAGRIAQKAIGLVRPARASAAMDTTQPGAAGVDIADIHGQACMAYVPRPYHGAAHLLWPEDLPLRDAAAGWGSILPNLKLIKTPGGHFSILQGENLRLAAEKIRECLAEDHA